MARPFHLIPHRHYGTNQQTRSPRLPRKGPSRQRLPSFPPSPTPTAHDLSLAYSPGVAEPCLEIEKQPQDAYRYTNKGNLVAVISNGTAVLGLGDIGALAGKPVMEGKSLLFKIYGGVDSYDIEVDEKDPERFIQVVKAIAPTFGGINLEDIKAPECFESRRRLKAELDIPVMHDDQHGTAIISCAGLLNALQVVGKRIEDVRIVVNGAGAAAISCARLYLSFGARRENLIISTRAASSPSRAPTSTPRSVSLPPSAPTSTPSKRPCAAPMSSSACRKATS